MQGEQTEQREGSRGGGERDVSLGWEPEPATVPIQTIIAPLSVTTRPLTECC